MILSAQSIRSRCINDTLIDPFFLAGKQNGLTFGLSSAGYDIRTRTQLALKPGDFALAASVEKFVIPNDLIMRIVDKSTWARRGICVQNTVAEPGWIGYLTLEITNHSKHLVVIHREDPIAQVMFELLDFPTIYPYDGKYQNQDEKPTPAILD